MNAAGSPAVRTCPLCGRDNRSIPPHRFSRGEWRLKKCESCRFLYLENAPAYDELEEELAWDKTLLQERIRRRAEEPLLHSVQMPLRWFRRNVLRREKLKRLVNRYFRPGPVLDVGCGSGRALANLDRHYAVHGIEISRRLAEKANERLAERGGIIVHAPATEGLSRFEEDKFSGVIMCSFLEHEAHPREALLSAHRVLQAEGGLVLKVPNYGCLNRRLRGHRWCGFRYPDHVNYFTVHSLTRLLVDSGFVVVRCSLLDRFPTSDNLWLVAIRR